jgi:hypothetical protein
LIQQRASALMTGLCRYLSLALLAKQGVLLIPITEVKCPDAVLRVHHLLVFMVCFVCYRLSFLVPVYNSESDFLSYGLFGSD